MKMVLLLDFCACLYSYFVCPILRVFVPWLWMKISLCCFKNYLGMLAFRNEHCCSVWIMRVETSSVSVYRLLKNSFNCVPNCSSCRSVNDLFYQLGSGRKCFFYDVQIWSPTGALPVCKTFQKLINRSSDLRTSSFQRTWEVLFLLLFQHVIEMQSGNQNVQK